ncbi:MAG TPA: 50S ribosomal protein L15 [Terriglobales bacterium]|nr:50S ribosomal protein L15 [Terriglobales bacterium]
MNLSNLKPAKGSRKDRKRVGRGPGSGWGKTAGRGSKGQLQGSGYSRKRDFEGGQMPLVRRIPKRGFTSVSRTEYTVVNLDSVGRIAKTEIGIEDLVASGLVQKASERVKVLGRGDLAAAKTVHAHKFSASAVKKIEAKGGKAVVIG